MRKKKLVLILLVLSILFLLIGCVAWGNTNANLDKLNSLQFTDCAEGENLSYITESGIEINLYFGEHSVKAENSYLLSDRKDRLEVSAWKCPHISFLRQSKRILRSRRNCPTLWASLPFTTSVTNCV